MASPLSALRERPLTLVQCSFRMFGMASVLTNLFKNVRKMYLQRDLIHVIAIRFTTIRERHMNSFRLYGRKVLLPPISLHFWRHTAVGPRKNVFHSIANEVLHQDTPAISVQIVMEAGRWKKHLSISHSTN